MSTGLLQGESLGRARGRSRLTGLAVGALLLAAMPASQALASTSKPVISGLTASPGTVPNAGTVTVSATVSGATTCTLTSSKKVTSLPASSSCESGSFSQEVAMPTVTPSKKPSVFKLKLTAAGSHGKGHAIVDVTVSVMRYSETPTAVQGIEDAVQLGAGREHVCAVLSGGDVSCWGEDQEGQMLGATKASDFDHPVPTLVGEAVQVVGGNSFSCAALADGHVQCSGNNSSGQLGDGREGGSPTPVEVVGLSSASEVAASGQSACALLSGHVECWGLGTSGQLGDGGESNSRVPVEVSGITDATQVAMGPGGETACALLAGGSVECWGSNKWGALGDGDSEETMPYAVRPQEVAGLTGVSSLSTGAFGSCALVAGGAVDCWGAVDQGPFTDVPVQVEGLPEASAVAAGSSSTCAVVAAGHVLCWGNNSWGELGDGGLSSSSTPVEVRGLTGAVSLSGGRTDMCALLGSGSIECWGNNTFGQLGNGSFA